MRDLPRATLPLTRKWCQKGGVVSGKEDVNSKKRESIIKMNQNQSEEGKHGLNTERTWKKAKKNKL